MPNPDSRRGDSDISGIHTYNGGIDAGQASQQLWNQFKEGTLPRLKDIESQLATRQGEFVLEATDSANKAVEMADQQANLSRETLGIKLDSGQQASNERLKQLSLASATTSAQNEAVDVAGEVNKNQAAALTSVQTGLTQEALGNLTGAATLKDARERGDIARDDAAKSANTATAATVVTLAAMMM